MAFQRYRSFPISRAEYSLLSLDITQDRIEGRPTFGMIAITNVAWPMNPRPCAGIWNAD